MEFGLSEAQKRLMQEMRVFGQEHFNRELTQRDQAQVFDRDLWDKSGERRLPGLCIPEEYGGRGLTAVDTVLALEAFGEGCEDGGFGFAVAAHLFAVAVPVWKFGSEEQKRHFLPRLSDGTWIGANAMTEAHGGSDAYGLRATAAKDEDSYLLQGTKTYVSNGPVADVVLTYLNTGTGKGAWGDISAFVLQKGLHAYAASAPIDKTGVRTCQMGEITLDGVVAQSADVLGATGSGGLQFAIAMGWERSCLGAFHLGTMQRLLYRAAGFVKERGLSHHQGVMHPLATLKARLEGARLLTYQAAWQLDQGSKSPFDASVAKLTVSELFKDVTTQLFQLYAGQAYRENHELERVHRDALGSTLYSGTSEVQREIITKANRRRF